MNSRSLLLVDADPGVQEVLTAILDRAGRSIQGASGCAEALERLRSAPYDVVVAGQDSNGADSLQFLRRVRALRPEARVILTGDADPARVIGAMRGRAYSYFHKPLPEGPLADMVQRALDSTSWQDDIRVLSAYPRYLTLEVRCKFEAVERTTHFMREISSGLPLAVCEDVSAAFRELLLNAVEHGGKSDPSKRVRLSVVRTARAVAVQMLDPGEGFSMDLLPHAAISNPAGSPTQHLEVRTGQGRRPGGFGILLTKGLVDELIYNECGNEVLFVKYL